MLCYVMLCYVMLRCDVPCCVPLCYVMVCVMRRSRHQRQRTINTQSAFWIDCAFGCGTCCLGCGTVLPKLRRTAAMDIWRAADRAGARALELRRAQFVLGAWRACARAGAALALSRARAGHCCLLRAIVSTPRPRGLSKRMRRGVLRPLVARWQSETAFRTAWRRMSRFNARWSRANSGNGKYAALLAIGLGRVGGAPRGMPLEFVQRVALLL